ncbi:pre-rRNA-processing protein IPI1 [Sporothrix brasiliensis 5110]|uniref:Pre-rRNA-processing protein n=1 Tax=Sporothrix brasiliensis 5110 TaxID=1398154 RepID=A0A0C2IR80_9PEZI|nr:pre-rRNA-processing protein IPI1 [Sporothrix brasiliensis 5110]KIH91516.1 pre-rRNA-processing protein IPI1 [Sporothrix brasiliensis 5110]
MGSSSKKKKEKQKDFQKPKLKVGKAKAKAANFTDTSFRTKCKSDNQRRDALAFLTSQLSSGSSGGSGRQGANAGNSNPVGTAGLLNRLLPLISDPAGPVRAQLLKLFRVLPPSDVRPAAGKILLYIRAGITNLSSAVREDALGALEWLLDVAGDELVACPGGWLKTLNGLGAMMGWVAAVQTNTFSSTGANSVSFSSSGWSSAPKTSFAGSSTATLVKGGGTGGSKAMRGASFARQLAALTKFLEIGLRRETPAPYNPQAYWDSLYRRQPSAPPPDGVSNSTSSSTLNPFGHLNLFGAPRDEDSEMYADREDRQRVFAKRWQAAIVRGIEEARREGGAVGRAAATLDDVLQAGMEDYNQMVTVS